MADVKIGLIGAGTVGSGVIKIWGTFHKRKIVRNLKFSNILYFCNIILKNNENVLIATFQSVENTEEVIIFWNIFSG